METKAPLYVLDTSVLIHDPNSLGNYRGSAIAIPIFVVMELDDLKLSARHEVASSARTASRKIVSLQQYGSLHDPGGVMDPQTGSTVYVVGNQEPWSGALKESASSRKMDHLILGSALTLQERFQHYEVVLVTKDVNLRILADCQGLKSEDYNQDRVQEDEIPTGVKVVPNISPEELTALYAPQDDTGPMQPYLVQGSPVQPNEFIVAEEGGQILRLRSNGKMRQVPRTFKDVRLTPRNNEQRMALDLLTDPTVNLVTLIGKAGTGKSILAIAAAIGQLDRTYDKVILSKPVVAMGKDLGYLPGTEAEKLQPWMLSFYDNLDQIMTTDNDVSGRKGVREKTWEQLFHSKKMEIQPLHSIRGRSIARALMIVDEAQNLSPHEVKTIVSRAATGTKVVLCGDPYQIDDAYLDQFTNGLVHVATSAKGSPIAGTITLTEGVRSPLAELAATKL